MKKELILKWEYARKCFQHYATEVSYGNVYNRAYNTQQANFWDKVVSELREKIK